jgi:hypothetical protein
VLNTCGDISILLKHSVFSKGFLFFGFPSARPWLGLQEGFSSGMGVGNSSSVIMLNLISWMSNDAFVESVDQQFGCR